MILPAVVWVLLTVENGKIVPSQGKGQSYEIQASSLEVVGWVDDPETYPIQPKAHSLRRQLWWWLVGLHLAAMALTALFSYQAYGRIIGTFMDEQMRLVADSYAGGTAFNFPRRAENFTIYRDSQRKMAKAAAAAGATVVMPLAILTYHPIHIVENTYAGSDLVALEQDLATIERMGAFVPADDDPLHVPHARLHAALAREFGPADELQPIYVRAPDATVLPR